MEKTTPATVKSSKKKKKKPSTWNQAQVQAVSNGYLVTLVSNRGYKTKQVICLTQEAVGEVIGNHTLEPGTYNEDF